MSAARGRAAATAVVLAVVAAAVLGAAGTADAQPEGPARPATAVTATATAGTPLDAAGRGAAPFGDAERGAALFAEHCAACHGPLGRGDGPLVDRLPAPPPSLADADRMADRAPAELWTIVTEGRLEANMPPFSRLLDDAERWDVVAWVRTFTDLHPVVQAVGDAAFGARCAACHAGVDALSAELAASDVPAGAPRGADGLVTRAPSALAARFEAVAEHTGLDAGAVDVAATLARLAARGSRPLAAPDAVTGGRLAGRVVRHDGVDARAPLSLTLGATTAGLDVELGVVALDPDGAFAVDGLPAGEAVRYEPEARFGGIAFRAGEAVTLAPDRPARDDVTIDVFAVEAGDPAAIGGVSSLAKADAARGELAVFEVWQIANDGTTVRVGRDGRPSFVLPLPTGARDVTLEDRTTRFDVAAASTSEPGGIAVRLPVPPGGLEIVASYAMPYRGRTAVLDRTLGTGAERLGLVVADAGASASGDLLAGPTPDRFGDVDVVRYSGGPAAPGQRWTVRLTDLPPAAEVPGSAQDVLGPAPPPVVDQAVLRRAAAVLAAVAVAAAIALAWLRPTGGARRRPAAYDRAVRTIAGLDTRFERGELAPRDYQRRRAVLVARAVALRPPSAAAPSTDPPLEE